MAREKETSPVVHRLRRIFGITVGVLLATTIAGVVFITTATVPSIVVANACLGVAGLTTVSGTGLAIGTIVSHNKLKKSRKKSRKLLKEISEIDSGKKKASSRHRVKIVNKFAKIQLKLCQISKTPLNGIFHSVSHMRTHKGTQAVNELDARTILDKTSGGKSNSKKISKLKNLIATESSKTASCKWTKSYENVVKGVPVYDRRTEISCMNNDSVTMFKSLANSLAPTDELGSNVIVTFKDDSKYPSTYARIADKSKASAVTEILLLDVKKTCEGMTKAEMDRVFPIIVEKRKINKNNSKIVEDTEQINNLTELDNYIQSLHSSSSKTK